jgi:Protein of unknwon function (DUF3310)
MKANDIQVGGTHYKDMPLQPWDVMEVVMSEQEFIGFLKGNIIKYAMRAGHKGDAQLDLEKAKHYKQKLHEVLGR